VQATPCVGGVEDSATVCAHIRPILRHQVVGANALPQTADDGEGIRSLLR